MQVIEEYGRTVEEATDKALKSLGVGESDVEVQIIDPGRKATSSGFGAKFARVKVVLKAGAVPAPPPPPPPPTPVSRVDDADEDLEESRSAPPPRGGRGGGRGRQPVREAPRPRPSVPERSSSAADDDEAEEEDLVPAFKAVRPESPDADAAERVLKEVLRLMEVEAEVERDYDRENSVRFNVVGEDLGALIGKYGQTIEAVQYLVNLIASRQNEDYDKVSVDIEGYRERRERTLEELATRMARKVKTEGKSVTLEPMLPSERRIIHMTLSEDPGIRTYSQGEEPMRKVIISPARRGGNR